MPAPIIKTGSIVCDGQPRHVPIGFIPDVVFAKLGTGSTPWMWWTPTSWCQRTQRVGAQDSMYAAIHGVTPNGDLMLGVDAQSNVAGETLYWFAIADNGSGIVNTTGWIGNALNGNTAIVGNTAPSAVLIKRDNTQEPAFRASAMTRTAYLGGAAVSSSGITAINGDGTLTLGTDAAVNQLSGGAIGEGHDCISFWQSTGLFEVVSWVGDGSVSRTISHTVANPCAAIVIADAAGVKAGFKTAEMPGASCAAADSLTYTNALTGLLSTGATTTYNASGVTYYGLVFGSSIAAQVIERPAKSATTKAIALRGASSSAITCGTDASLSRSGAFSLEFWGQLHGYTAGANYATIMARSAGTEGRADSDGLVNAAGTRLDGTWSWGIFAARPNDLGDWAGPQFVICTTNYNNIFDSGGSENNISTKPWRTGILVPKGLFHVLVTHDGNGRWRLYLNGKLAKQRNINMTGVSLADDAGARVNAGAGTGHTTQFGSRWNGSAGGQLAKLVMCGASVYGSELTPAQAKQMYRRNFLGDTTQADIAPVERWLADNATGTSLPASINSANNGTISSSAGVVLRDAWAAAL